MTRPVDAAMDEERPEKRTMRDFWADAAESRQDSFDGSVPLFVTLSGAEGRDIQVLVDRQLIELTEVGGIAQQDQRKVVAIETDPMAVLNLSSRFPGLKILEQRFESLVAGTAPTAWPKGQNKECCRGILINLDLNSALMSQVWEGQVVFPVLEWIRKLSQLHAEAPRIEWGLCLTLHGEINWTTETCQMVMSFLGENFAREPEFGDDCRVFFGDTLFNEVEGRAVSFTALSRQNQQKVIMALVPKKISHLVHNQGWHVITTRNIRYGGKGEERTVVLSNCCISDTNQEPLQLLRLDCRMLGIEVSLG